MIQQKQLFKFTLDQEGLPGIEQITKPLISIIINPQRLSAFNEIAKVLQNSAHASSTQGNFKLIVKQSTPYLLYTGVDPLIARAILTVSKHLICYHLDPQLQSSIQSKWWQHKSLSHMYSISQITTVYFFNPRIKVTKHLKGLNYLLDSQLFNTIKQITEQANPPSQLNLSQLIQLLQILINDPNFKDKDYFTDRLNYIQLYKLQSNRQVLKQVIQKMQQQNAPHIPSIIRLDSTNRQLFERKIKKMQIFNQIVEKQNNKLRFLERKYVKQKVEQTNTSRWKTNKVEYLQRLAIIALVIVFIQILFGHNLFSLAISLILAIFYLKFAG